MNVGKYGIVDLVPTDDGVARAAGADSETDPERQTARREFRGALHQHEGPPQPQVSTTSFRAK